MTRVVRHRGWHVHAARAGLYRCTHLPLPLPLCTAQYTYKPDASKPDSDSYYVITDEWGTRYAHQGVEEGLPQGEGRWEGQGGAQMRTCGAGGEPVAARAHVGMHSPKTNPALPSVRSSGEEAWAEFMAGVQLPPGALAVRCSCNEPT